jgi:hypothetical protein
MVFPCRQGFFAGIFQNLIAMGRSVHRFTTGFRWFCTGFPVLSGQGIWCAAQGDLSQKTGMFQGRREMRIDEAVIRKFRITAADGKSYETNHYALDVAFYIAYQASAAFR